MNRKNGSNSADIAAFGFLINALGGGGNKGSVFPENDANDFFKGARFIPGEVTLARRAGQTVDFVVECG